MNKKIVNRTIDYINSMVDYSALVVCSIIKRSKNSMINDINELRSSITKCKSQAIEKITYESAKNYKFRVNKAYRSIQKSHTSNMKRVIDLEKKISTMEKKLEEFEKHGLKPSEKNFKQVKRQIGQDRRMLLKMIVSENKMLKGI